MRHGKTLYKDGQEKLRYIIVNTIQWLTDMRYITEEKIFLFIVIVLFILVVFFLWGNFTSFFFQSNDKWVYAFNRNIFIFKFYILLFFYIKIFFSLTTTYDIPFLQIHTFFSFSILLINDEQLKFYFKQCQRSAGHFKTD